MSNDKFRLMIIDDEEDMRFILRGFLEDDYEVVDAENGEDALQKLPYYQPDLIIIDIMMPVMDGLDFAREAKKSPEFNAIPCIFLTALDSRENMMKGYETGADVYLTKPLVPERLIRNIKLSLEKRAPLVKKFPIEQINKGIDLSPPKPKEEPPPEKTPEPEHKKPDTKPKVSPKIQAAQERKGGASPLKRFTRKPRIMVVSENTDLVPLFKHLFLNVCEVVGINTVMRAITKIPLWEPDIFIIELSGQNTLQAVALIHKSKGLNKAPLLILSSKNSAREAQQSMAYGADYYHGTSFYPVDVALALEDIADKKLLSVRKKKLSYAEIQQEIELQEQEQQQIAEAKSAGTAKKNISSLLSEQHVDPFEHV